MAVFNEHYLPGGSGRDVPANAAGVSPPRLWHRDSLKSNDSCSARCRGWAARRAEETLAAERVARARLAGKILQGAHLSIVAAIALRQLDPARPVVLAAFPTISAAFGVAFELAVGLGSAKAVQAAWERLTGRREDE